MRHCRLSLESPRDFNFWRTAYSHGWCALPPFSHNVETKELSRILELDGNVLIQCRLTAQGHTILVDAMAKAQVSASQQKSIIRQLRTCLRMDEDFTEFHREARKHSAYRWITSGRSGRMLRSPTVFEDVVKMICTTNCTWGLTTLMVTNLVQHLGKPLGNALHAFPSPAAIAGSTEQFLRTNIKAGYRSPFLLELSGRVASGELDIESWRTTDASTEELFKQMRDIKGIGPYAAGNLMKLVGRYDYLGLDSWVRSRYYKLHRNGRTVKDATIEKDYQPLGKWRGLFFWLEMTQDWHEDKFSL